MIEKKKKYGWIVRLCRVLLRRIGMNRNRNIISAGQMIMMMMIVKYDCEDIVLIYEIQWFGNVPR